MGLAAVIEAVSSFLPYEATTLVGEESLAQDGTPMRIVWVPQADSFTAPQERGNPERRSLATRRMAVNVHLWGANLDEAETMLEGFVYALRSSLGPNYELLSGAWLGQALAARGRVYILGIAIHVPVPEPALGRVTITGEMQDVALQN